LSHLNESTYPVLNVNELMTPMSGSGSSNHNPGYITVGILKDIGWAVNEQYLTTDYIQKNPLQIVPDPNNGVFEINGLMVNDVVRLYTATGQLISEISVMPNACRGYFPNLANGIYLVCVNRKGVNTTLQLVVNK